MQNNTDAYLNYLNTVSSLLKNMVEREMTTNPKIYSELLPFWDLSQEISGPLKVLIVGEFKTGKSTFINALLKKRVLKSDVVPATAVITNICYGNDDNITVQLKDKTCWIYPMSELAPLTAEGNKSYDKIRNNIEQVTIYLQNDFLKYVTLVDSPGINVLYDYHMSATESVLSKVDAVIWLMSANQPAKRSEIEKINKLPEHLKPIVIINAMDTIDAEEDSPEDIIKLVEKKVGAKAHGVYGISALSALEGYEKNKRTLLEESNFSQIESVFKNDLCQNWYVYKYISTNERLKQHKDKQFIKEFIRMLQMYYPGVLED